MNYFVADPHWGWEIVSYFFLGGIAAGSYFLAVLIEWFGSAEDEPLARSAYLIAFPLILVCSVLLIIDLDRPERFWHMLIKSDVVNQAIADGFPTSGVGWLTMLDAPGLKYWSPMSAGSWALAVFGGCTFCSFLAAVRPQRWPGRWLRANWPRFIVQTIGCGTGFFVASYTGALLSATNQPMWSDTVWLAPLFLASATSTSLATLSLIARWKQIGTEAARARLESVEPPVLCLELLILGVFVVSIGDTLGVVLRSIRGSVFLFGTLTLGIFIPMLLYSRIGRRFTWKLKAAGVCALIGGLLLRFGAVTTPGELLRRGQSVADISRHGTDNRPR